METRSELKLKPRAMFDQNAVEIVTKREMASNVARFGVYALHHTRRVKIKVQPNAIKNAFMC